MLTTRIYRDTPRNLRFLARQVQEGELVAIPTETVYGLAADATSERACEQIFQVKERPANDPLIIHVRNQAQAQSLTHWNSVAGNLAAAFWPGPLTLVLPKRDHVPDVVTSGLPSAAVRMPAHPTAQRLLAECNRPLAAPSANPFGYISPTSAEHVRTSLGGRIRFILDGGPCGIGIESTIVDVREPDELIILRPGAITRQDIVNNLGPATRVSHPQEKKASHSPAKFPGQFGKHYSPRTPLQLVERIAPPLRGNEGRIFFHKAPGPLRPGEFTLSLDGTTISAAHRLYDLLRTIDLQGFKTARIERVPPTDELAEAINDRLSRASMSAEQAASTI